MVWENGWHCAMVGGLGGWMTMKLWTACPVYASSPRNDTDEEFERYCHCNAGYSPPPPIRQIGQRFVSEKPGLLSRSHHKEHLHSAAHGARHAAARSEVVGSTDAEIMPLSFWGDAAASRAETVLGGAVGGAAVCVGEEDGVGGFGAISAGFDDAQHQSEAAGVALSGGDALAEPELRAVLRFLMIFDALGSAALTTLVGADFRSKAAAVRGALKRERTETVRGLVEAERKRPPRPLWDAAGSEGLRWARRILMFVDALVGRLLTDERMELRQAACEAYRMTLAKNHVAITRTIFENALALLPDRKVFLCNLFGVEDPSPPQLAESLAAMHHFRASAKPHIDMFNSVFAEEDA